MSPDLAQHGCFNLFVGIGSPHRTAYVTRFLAISPLEVLNLKSRQLNGTEISDGVRADPDP